MVVTLVDYPEWVHALFLIVFVPLSLYVASQVVNWTDKIYQMATRQSEEVEDETVSDEHA